MAKVSKGMSRLCAHVLRVDDRFFLFCCKIICVLRTVLLFDSGLVVVFVFGT